MSKIDLHQQITDQLVAAIEAGAKPWARPWTAAGGSIVPVRSNGEAYRGINVLLLWAAAMAKGYGSGRWMTFNQAKAFGGMVRKGEKATQIVFFKTLEVEADKDGGSDEGEGTRKVGMLRGYHVFNVDQIDGLPDRFAPAPVAIVAGKERDAAAEAAIRSSGARIVEDGGERAYYHRGTDDIHLPAFDRFTTVGGYLATMAHEVVHWTGAPHRLDRTKGKAFGDADYAFEELVAEIGSAFVCARLGVAGEHIDNHAAYVGNWLQALKNDKRAIFRAASLAQAAADMVLAEAGQGAAGQTAAVEPVAAAERVQFALAL
ncbi:MULTISPECIES: ArdC family protein [unclassified Sphingomonas]|uniref:ArdC family protein n=1 Tax=unclassified Sphingomonas TaxID=196159 RepID=UPI0009E6A986|nr:MULTISPECIES: zincin-like metallopeptidase domain-containing protein [unclassified Sphingomonas]